MHNNTKHAFCCRDVMEVRQAERKAWAQVEMLKSALDEHSLELRVKAANEAEAACQQRLAAAEAEIARWRERGLMLQRGSVSYLRVLYLSMIICKFMP